MNKNGWLKLTFVVAMFAFVGWAGYDVGHQRGVGAGAGEHLRGLNEGIKMTREYWERECGKR